LMSALFLLTPFAWMGCGDAGGIVTVTGGSTTANGTGGSSTNVGGGGHGGSDCGTGVSRCDDACVNLTNDPNNCGRCGVTCKNGEVCSDSACSLSCVGGSSRCDDRCVDLVNDPGNCGQCGKKCDDSQVCSTSICAVDCLGGSKLCGALCVETKVDPKNCGACGKVCPTGDVCSDSACCSAICSGACVELQTDPTHCGSCEIACIAGQVCQAAICRTSPTVILTNPIDGAQSVALDRKVDATFSAPMDPLTLTTTTFTLKQGATSVAGTVTSVGATATFAPAASYMPNVTLTATITTGAKDTNGTALAADHVWTFKTGTTNAQAGVVLGAASTYAVLAFNTVTNVNDVGTIVTGDLGISPGAALVGFPPGVVTGVLHLGDLPAATAEAALLAAYADASGRLGGAALPGDLAGLTFAPGLYQNATAVMLSTGNFTLDANGDANAVFIFQIGSTLTTNPATQVILSGGAKATNVYWAVGSSAVIGTTSKFKGTIMAASAITMNTGAALEGRALAKGAAIALDTNAITVPAP
jgi:hypothetical protein